MDFASVVLFSVTYLGLHLVRKCLTQQTCKHNACRDSLFTLVIMNLSSHGHLPNHVNDINGVWNSLIKKPFDRMFRISGKRENFSCFSFQCFKRKCPKCLCRRERSLHGKHCTFFYLYLMIVKLFNSSCLFINFINYYYYYFVLHNGYENNNRWLLFVIHLKLLFFVGEFHSWNVLWLQWEEVFNTYMGGKGRGYLDKHCN